MKKRIERGFIVFTKENEFGKVGCHVPLGQEHDVVKIEMELDKKLKEIKDRG